MAKPSPKHAKDPRLVALGVTLRSERKRLGLSQELLALDSGIDRSYVGGIERGEHNLTIIGLIKIADALSMKPSELLAKCGV